MLLIKHSMKHGVRIKKCNFILLYNIFWKLEKRALIYTIFVYTQTQELNLIKLLHGDSNTIINL